MANTHTIQSIVDDSGVRSIATITFAANDIEVGELVLAFPNTYSNDEIVDEVARVADTYFADRESGLTSEISAVVEQWNNQLIEEGA